MSVMLSRIFDLIGTKHGASKELADHLGIKASLITDWKSGRIKSYPKYASQIAAYYGVSLDWLSGATDDKEQKNTPTPKSEGSETRLKIEALLDEMSDDQLKKYLGVLQLLQK